MKFLEYGNASAPTILMIHGMGMTAESSFGYAMERPKDRCHILLACLTYPLPDTAPLANMEVTHWYGVEGALYDRRHGRAQSHACPK